MTQERIKEIVAIVDRAKKSSIEMELVRTMDEFRAFRWSVLYIIAFLAFVLALCIYFSSGWFCLLLILTPSIRYKSGDIAIADNLIKEEEPEDES